MAGDNGTHAALQARNEDLQRRVTELEQELNTLRAQRDRAVATEQALSESEARYRTLVETSPSAILLADLEGTISFCNQQAAQLFGYRSTDDLCGKNSADLILFDHRNRAIPAHIRQFASVEKLRNVEHMLRRSDGSRFPAEVSSAVVTNRQGLPTALVIIVQDISERKQTEHALTDAYHHLEELNEHVVRSRNLLQAVFDGLDDGLLLLDDTGYVQIINRSLATLLGSTPQKLTGQNWATLYPRIAPDFPNHLALKPTANGRNHYQHTRYLNLDGATRILDVQTIALHDATQTTGQLIVHVVDVTETVQFQARMIENERFIASGKLAASVAHEINTPLQALQTALGLARKMPTEAERETFLVHAQEEIQRVARIVRQLLDLYRPNAATAGPVEINSLLERLLLLVGKRLRDQRITVERELAPGLPPLLGRAEELMQVLLNLLINALDAMADGGVLWVQTSLAHDQRRMPHDERYRANDANVMVADHSALVIKITDSGGGINPTLHKRIFEPFVTTKEGGTGLGLSISSQIVKQHGGEITLESQMGVGSTFTVVLPLRAGPTE